MKPIVSIYVPSIRPENWLRQHASIKNSNNTTFELIYIAPVLPPAGNLPPEIHYIHSTVKPAQCAQIGWQACEGEFCIFAQDDLVFGPGTIDILVTKWRALNEALNNDLVVVSCMPYLNNVPLETFRYRFWDGDRGSPMTPIGGLYKKSTMDKLGGIDRNFICTAWDIDLAMRLFEMGGYGIFCEGTCANEIVPPGIPRLCSYGAKMDRPYLHELWTISQEEYAVKKNTGFEIQYMNPGRRQGVICKHRKHSLAQYSPVDIMTISQGPTGRWV